MQRDEEHLSPKLERIAIAIDFGAPSVEAAQWVARTLAPTAELTLVFALDVASAAPPGVRRPSAELVRGAREFAEERLRQLARDLGDRVVRIVVREDRPAPGIAAVAEASGVDLIVVGPHGGRESVPGIGSTAERLIRMSSIPVLLVVRPRAGDVRKLLVAVDDVALTPSVMHWADLISTEHEAHISLIHVLDTRRRDLAGWQAASTRADVPGQDGYPAVGDYIGATEQWLARLSRELTDNSAVEIITSMGVPGDEVRETARRLEADLVVMGRRGRERLIPGVMGSTASTLLRGAPCPVLIVVDPPDALFDNWDATATNENASA